MNNDTHPHKKNARKPIASSSYDVVNAKALAGSPVLQRFRVELKLGPMRVRYPQNYSRKVVVDGTDERLRAWNLRDPLRRSDS